MQSFRGAVKTFSFPEELSAHLGQFSRGQNATPFMILLAAFQTVLARYSGQDDVVVGTPIANRNRTEIEGLIGFFANTLVLRTRVSGSVSFSDLLAQVKHTALEAYAHQDIPFEKLVEELRPERSLSHNPLFQVLFSLQNAPRQAFELQGLQLQPLEVAGSTAKFDLSLFLVETAEGLRGRMEYNTDLFDEATIARMLEHYRVLLAGAVANPALPVAQLPMLSESERRQILQEWNATESDYPRQLCLHELFERQVERTPEAVACVAEGGSLTYRELNRRANQLAHFLKKRGARPGQRVGLFIERSLAMMVGLLGIQKSGAAYVPLDPSYPAERLRLTLDDAQAPVLLTQQSLLSSLPEQPAQVVCLDSDWEKIAQQSTSNPASGATPEDLVYVIFTSGSTGRPKGVEVPHRAVVNLLTFMGKELEMGPEDVFPALASFAFDMSIPELYLGLVTGGRVIVGERHLAANGEALAEVLRATGATIVHATPTTWNLLLGAGFTGQGLKRVIGAEALPRELSTRLLAADPSLYNFYGPTETTVWSAFHHFRSPEEPVVVGRPLANTRIYILDGHGQAVPVGVPGEIHIAGEGVSCGYLNRPELTAEKFIPDPFAAQPEAKMYRTGDRGRFLGDGRIEFQGRVDNQVKVRGYRIELGEIETVLGQHPGVQECVVTAREDVPGDKRLVGYVVGAGGERADAAELRAWVKQRLPEYMTPVAFVTLERFPLSPNGKVDRKQLPAPEYVRPELSRAYQGARTPAEEVIAGIWAEVLKLDQVGMEDDFFELGGHSLLATQVVSRIRQAFGVELPLRAMFEAPTVAGLAARTETLAGSAEGLEAPPITRVARDGALPLSFAQQRLWFLDQLEPENPLYNVPHIVRLTGGLNARVLEQALDEIVRRHETLRTRFESVDDQPVQVIAPQLKVPLEIRDLTSLPEG
ncbi:MAG TPA: amino acid adenylation domain-containing protein, partial [Steroidobacteraceae bacterium]